jgi:integrase
MMGCGMTTTTNVRLRGNSYYARLTVPDRLRPSVGHREFFRTLKTQDFRDAMTKSEPLLSEWRSILSIANYALESGLVFINADVQQNQLTVEAIARVDKALIELHRIIHLQSHFTHGERGALLKEIIDARHMIEYLESGQADFKINFKNYMAKCGIWISEKSLLWDTRYSSSVDIFRTGIETYVKTHKERAVIKLANMSASDYINHSTAPPIKPALVNKLLKPSDASDSISECFARVSKSNPKIGNSKKETGRWQNVISAFINYLGEDKPANYVTYAEANDFLLMCADYPAIRNKKELVGKTFTQKVEYVRERRQDDLNEKTLTARTIKDWRGKLAVVFDIPLKAGEAVLNPFRNQTVRVGRDSVRKIPFSDDDLIAIFNAIKSENRDRYWITSFLLYHGCRLSEFSDRKLKDLKLESGIWYIDITDAKNGSSIRRLPIHRKIIDLGFIDYIKSQNRQNTDYLFGSFNTAGRMIQGRHRDSTPPSSQFSNWFNDPFLRGKLNINTPEKTLHGFRHNWISTASQIMDRIAHIKLAGHTPDHVHDRIYTHRNLRELKRDLDKVNYPLIEDIV